MLASGESAWQLLRQDAARWIQPQHYGSVDQVTPRLLVKLLWLHRGLRAMAWVRLATELKRRGVRGSQQLISNRLVSKYGLEIGPFEAIGGGCYIAHPVGCTLQVERLGREATIIAAVTVGARSSYDWPRLGDRVFLGTGCRVLGNIDVGDEARIGANAVVLADIPKGMTAIGVPARNLDSSARPP